MVTEVPRAGTVATSFAKSKKIIAKSSIHALLYTPTI